MNKQKLKHLPVNILYCILTFPFAFTILHELIKLDTLPSIGIALYIYLLDVIRNANDDYLTERIKKLEDEQNK